MAEHEEQRDEETTEQQPDEQSGEERSDGPVDEAKAIEDDPAYSPENEMLKDIKGG